MQTKLLGIISADFYATDQLVIRFFFVQIMEKKMGIQWDSTTAIHKLQESV
jgi:hypothetical protein